jgi:succinate dehydrogenase/fumarate reductase-like Fe-S protein
MQTYELELRHERMLLDALVKLKAVDETPRSAARAAKACAARTR